jgi:endonuclease-3
MPRPRGAKQRSEVVRERLAALYPDAECALVHDNAFQLLAATIMSAQTTDENVNKVTPKLFARYPTPRDLAHADPEDVERIIHSTGFFRSKTKNIIGMARALDDDFDGEVPTELEDLVKLPGVGRKTANVVLGNAFHKNEGIVVDTHVARLSERLGLTTQQDPEKIERDLMELIPKNEWTIFSHRMIFHGRQVCFARKPNCPGCILEKVCPKVGVAS